MEGVIPRENLRGTNWGNGSLLRRAIEELTARCASLGCAPSPREKKKTMHENEET